MASLTPAPVEPEEEEDEENKANKENTEQVSTNSSLFVFIQYVQLRSVQKYLLIIFKNSLGMRGDLTQINYYTFVSLFISISNIQLLAEPHEIR